MFEFSDPHRFRKTIAGWCMILAPVLLLAGTVFHPERDRNEAAYFANMAKDLDAQLTSHLLVLGALVLAIPVVMGLMHMLREREVALGHFGGGLAMLGLVAGVGLVAIEIVMWQMGAQPDRAAMTTLVREVFEATAIQVPFVIGSAAFAVGMALLGAGLYRARACRSWTAALVGLGPVVLAIGAYVASGPVTIVGAAFLLVGLFTLGRMVLEETVEEWEHTREQAGFRPLARMH